MPLRFQKRVSIIPGLRLNLSRGGASVSLGHRGVWYTVGTRGQRGTVGLPGSGLFYTTSEPWHRPRAGDPLGWIIVLALLAFLYFLLVKQ